MPRDKSAYFADVLNRYIMRFCRLHLYYKKNSYDKWDIKVDQKSIKEFQ